MSKRDAVKKNHNQKKKQDFWVILIISVIALVIIGVIVVSKLPKPVASIEVAAKPMESGLNAGDPNAPVKVVEFADFQCPYCKLYWQDTETTIMSKYVATNKVYYTYSPMAFIGQESIDSTEAAYCANDQNKFWEYREYLFTNQGSENSGALSQSNLIAFAKNLNLDVNTFTSCLTSGKYASKVNDDNTYASQQGVSSTPSFLVNGKVYSSADLQKAIDDALAATK
jgi:protein-disulfide isomerase